jgi:hypothetical protein
MANVPNTTTFTLQNVTSVVGGTSLSGAFALATDNKFDATYKGSKNRLTNFQNYCGGYVNFCQIGTTGCGGAYVCACLGVVTSPAMVAGECYCITIGGSISTTGQGTSSCGCFQILCNAANKYCCVVGANTCAPSLGATFQVNYGDTVKVITCAVTTSTACGGTANSNACLNSSNIKGGFSNGACITCYMMTG